MSIAKNVFGHRVNANTAALDALFLEKCHTVKEIADMLDTTKSRVMNHVKHLVHRKLCDCTVAASGVVSLVHPVIEQGRTSFDGVAMVRSFCKNQNKKTQRFDALSILGNR